MNRIIGIAQNRHSRSYITPDDVGEAIREVYFKHEMGSPELQESLTRIRLDVLEILGNQTGCGAEDSGLCAFLAWRGEPPELEN